MTPPPPVLLDGRTDARPSRFQVRFRRATAARVPGERPGQSSSGSKETERRQCRLSVGHFLLRDSSLHPNVDVSEVPVDRRCSVATKPGIRLRPLGDSPGPLFPPFARYQAGGDPDGSLRARQDTNGSWVGRTHLAVNAPTAIRDHAPSSPVSGSDNRQGKAPLRLRARKTALVRTTNAYCASPGLARARTGRAGRCRGRAR